MNYEGNPRYANNRILDLTFNFSLEIILFSDELRKLKQYELSSQVLRAGTSIGANMREAQNSESSKDFLHKVKIALKEADETEYWLRLLFQLFQYSQIPSLLIKLEEILKILNKICSTVNANIRNPKK
jgi:four helix bundle protein